VKRGVGVWVLAFGILASLWGVRELAGRSERRRHLPQREGILAVSDLSHAVAIRRDPYGVPHIDAETASDAFFALGFVHAQDRLVQMEWLRRAAQGRTAEWQGPAGLEVDRWARTLGFARRAAAEAQGLSPSTQRALVAYTRGINARIARLARNEIDIPGPLRALGMAPEPWEPADCVAVVRAWAWGLNGSVEASLVLSDLIEKLGPRAARVFFPPGAAGRIDPLGPSPRKLARRFPTPVPPAFRDPLRGALGLRGRSVGSSAWLVNGLLTASGEPFLAGDLHLEATVPGLLYPAHWSAGDSEVAGFTLPGVPVVWVGRNRRVMWTVTEARAAVVDLFRETLDEVGAPERYRTARGWRPLERREETIQVRGAEAERLVVLSTRRGPLIHHLLPGERPPLAIAWPGNQPGEGISALLGAGWAADAEAFRAALAQHHEPVFVFLFADREGGGGRQLAGFVPARNLPTELLPVEARAYHWRGRIPFQELPAAQLEADTVWLVAADNALAEFQAEQPIEWWWRLGRRAERIDGLLREATRDGPVKLTDMIAVQVDVSHQAARNAARLVSAMVDDPSTLTAEALRVHDFLRGWDGSADAGNAGAAAWHVMRIELLATLEETLGPELLARFLGLRGVSPDALLEELLVASTESNGPADQLVDRNALHEAARQALRRAGLELRLRLGPDPNRWNWGRLHALRFRPFGWSPSVWGNGAELGPFAYGGDGGTVAAAEYAMDQPFDARVVSSFRIAMDAAQPHLALAAIAPGVAELPGDPLRTTGLERWLEGRPQVLASDAILIDELSTQKLVLEPEE